jgi:hypothetical protein
MYFKDFPQFLYDFKYVASGKTRTSLVKDITRNIRFRKDILSNITLFDEYDIVDGETPEIIAEKFYGTPEYHWVVMLANERFDNNTDFPLMEPELQKHISTIYNPTLYSDDWYWKRATNGQLRIHIKITAGEGVPFDPNYLTAPVDVTLYDSTKRFIKVIHFPSEDIGLDPLTQYFDFAYNEPWDITQFGKGNANQGVGGIRIYVDTKGREHNPVKYINAQGFVVNPGTDGATPVTGEQMHRAINDQKRRIKIISPKLLATVLRNYKELL